ncbi:MAG: hypothetical protein LBR62_01775 [Puniceicoccales bacterium]|jgi:hypothetical protein|nr:hypothetical protein [Puniceicoccales bacterium]
MFEAGAGQMGSYSRCCWQTKGEGQFKPESGSHPYLGTLGTTEKVAEYRVEMRCPAEKRADVVAALKKAHSYECPAYGCLPLEDEEETENPE